MNKRQAGRRPFPGLGPIIGVLTVVVLVLAGCGSTTGSLNPSPSKFANYPSPSAPGKGLTPSPTPTSSATPNLAKATLTLFPTATGCDEITGKMVSATLESETLGKVYPFEVYLPPCYDPKNPVGYPVLYLLHGLRADQTQWEEIGVLAEADRMILAQEVSPFIVVMPLIPDLDTYPSELNGQVIIGELMPYIDGHYATQADAAHRAIGGLSRGAVWALRLAGSDWGVFGKVGLHSSALDDWEIGQWVATLKALPAEERPQLYLDSGVEDPDLSCGVKLEAALAKANIPHLWNMFAGSHDMAYWSAHLGIYLEWYAQGWGS